MQSPIINMLKPENTHDWMVMPQTCVPPQTSLSEMREDWTARSFWLNQTCGKILHSILPKVAVSNSWTVTQEELSIEVCFGSIPWYPIRDRNSSTMIAMFLFLYPMSRDSCEKIPRMIYESYAVMPFRIVTGWWFLILYFSNTYLGWWRATLVKLPGDRIHKILVSSMLYASKWSSLWNGWRLCRKTGIPPKQRNFGLKKKTRNLRGYTPYCGGIVHIFIHFQTYDL